MAEEQQQDDAQKTEEPTQKKLDDAHKKGDVARSQELKHWSILAAVAIVVGATGDQTVRSLGDLLSGFMARSHKVPADGGAILNVIRELGGDILATLAVPLTILVIAALLGSMIQHKPVFTAEKIKPKLNKISPMTGLKRMFSSHSLMEFAKTLFKFVTVAAVAIFIVWPERSRLEHMVTLPLNDVMALTGVLAFRLIVGVVIVMTAIAAADLLFQRAQHTKKMRMTKQEVKDEHKQMEGDPHVKARLRQIRMERSRRRMMAAVPEADVVITNPTHYAVALAYDQAAMAAPKLVAKGADRVAQKIRELAEEHDIPLVENPPLARAIHAGVELDEEIPPEHYQAVAEIISYVMRLARGERVRPPAYEDSEE